MKKLILSTALALTLMISSIGTFAQGLIKLGNTSDEVYQIQQTLKDKGYFESDITGYYGYITKYAVIRFQEDQGIMADGIVGPVTRQRLYSQNSTSSPSYSQEDLYWLSRLIEAEAKGESYTGKVAVGSCVMNRVASNLYPNTVKEVIFDTKYGVQYTPVANGAIYNTPSTDSINAAIDALNGVKPVGDSLFFYNPSTSTSSWISANREYHSTIGNHNFHL